MICFLLKKDLSAMPLSEKSVFLRVNLELCNTISDDWLNLNTECRIYLFVANFLSLFKKHCEAILNDFACTKHYSHYKRCLRHVGYVRHWHKGL